VLDQAAPAGLRHFTCKFSYKIALVSLVRSKCISLHKLAQSVGRALGLRHFACKFSCKMALVTHPSAFRLSKLAQSVGRALGLRHLTCKFSYNMKRPSAFRLRSSHKVWVALFVCGILPVNSCAIWLFVKCQMHFDCAGSHKVWVAVLACGIVYVNYCAIWLVNAFDMSTCMSTAQAQARTKCGPRSWPAAFYPCKFSYMRAVQAHSDCAGSHKVWSEVSACSILSVNSCAICLVKCEMHFDCAARTKCGSSSWPLAFYL